MDYATDPTFQPFQPPLNKRCDRGVAFPVVSLGLFSGAFAVSFREGNGKNGRISYLELQTNCDKCLFQLDLVTLGRDLKPPKR